MSWTKSGTISLTNNNAIVYGAGTTWASSNLVRGGDILKSPDGKDYEVLSVQSNTQLTLATPYLGTTASSQAYALVHTGLLPAELAVDVSDLQSKYLTTVSQLYEWETSTADSVPLTNPATGVTNNVTPLGYLLTDLPGDFIAARDDAEESKNAAITAAATAENYAELAIEAWSASTEPNETLATISSTLHSGTIVKLLIYDTSKDSDPTWPDRCTHTSWHNEALGFTGKWLGQVATTATAWATSGAAAGDGFQNSTDKKYYVLTGTSTATEIFRGNKRGFPAKTAIVVESGRVVIYDLTQAGCPMWRVFSGAHTSCVFRNGLLLLGSTGGVYEINFATDVLYFRYRASGSVGYRADHVVNWPALVATGTIGSATAIVNSTVNDVAITVLPTAPTDLATGMPVPSIFVGTAGGLSTITAAGAVVNSLSTVAVSKVTVDKKTLTTARSDGVVSVWNDVTTITTSPDTTYTSTSVPAIKGTITVVC